MYVTRNFVIIATILSQHESKSWAKVRPTAAKTRWKVLWESTIPRESYCGLPKQWGCAVNGTAVAAVLIDQSRSFINLHIRYVHWIAARLPNCEIWVFCCQQLATLATPTVRSIKCKQSPVYGVFWPLLPHLSTDRNETLTWSSLSH